MQIKIGIWAIAIAIIVPIVLLIIEKKMFLNCFRLKNGAEAKPKIEINRKPIWQQLF